MKVFVVGITTRDIATSAAAAGYSVISLDFFADRDQPEGAKAYSLQRDFGVELSLSNLARAGMELVKEADAVVYGAGVECEPALWELAKGKQLLGNSPETITDVRDLRQVSKALINSGVCIAPTIFPEVLPRAKKHGKWLRKNLKSSGGMGVHFWDGVTPLSNDEILQRFIPGKLASATFLSNKQQACLIGLSYQYSGLSELGAEPFWWCGNAAPLFDPAIEKAIKNAANTLTKTFGLSGLNSADFVIFKNRLYLIEINPRYSGSTELYERIYGINAFELHVQACNGNLPPFESWKFQGLYWGKGILYAQKGLVTPDTSNWTAIGIRDVPRSGEYIPQGAPICSVLASSKTLLLAWQAVLRKACLIQTVVSKNINLPRAMKSA